MGYNWPKALPSAAELGLQVNYFPSTLKKEVVAVYLGVVQVYASPDTAPITLDERITPQDFGTKS